MSAELAVPTAPPLARILVIDDDQSMRELLHAILKDDYLVVCCGSAFAGMEIIRQQDFDLVLLDIMLGDSNGLDVLKRIKQLKNNVEVVMITVIKDLRTAVEAMRYGAFDYITKSFEYDEVKRIVHKALEQRRLKEENLSLKTEISQYTKLEYVEGEGTRIREINQMISRIAAMPSNVLIQGESGTGKEVVARHIHRIFQAAAGEVYRPFISVNVAGIPADLIESTLFGHERGAFTGAVRQHLGKFELGNGGTLFLDEIGELRLDLQAKLLRAIQEREIERVGGEFAIPVNVRIIAATNSQLLEKVKLGTFREDLYYRLNVIPIHMPPLRERLEDIPTFVGHFIAKCSTKLGKKVLGVDQVVLTCLQTYPWPGNVRELENVIERMVALSQGETLTMEDMPIEMRFFDSADESGRVEYEEVLKKAIATFERRFLIQALVRNSWILGKTAENLGIHRKTLEYKLKKLDLQPVVDSNRLLRRQDFSEV